MKFTNIFFLTTIVVLIHLFSWAQGGLPIYSDYLTDNYYLLHPSMAGISNCNKIRLTGPQQWFGDENAPSLQTMSINGRIGESSSGVGAIFFNDENGYHSHGVVRFHLTQAAALFTRTMRFIC